MKKRSLYFLFLLLTFGCSTPQSIKWDYLSFYKPAENPVLKADSTFTFIDPIKKESVKWQRADVFNPAAIVRNNKVCGIAVGTSKSTDSNTLAGNILVSNGGNYYITGPGKLVRR